MAIKHITHICVYVRDQDQALDWYTEKLGFKICDDNSEMVPGFRWLTVSPDADSATQMVLMPAGTDADQARIGANGICVLGTDDCRGDCAALAARGVEVVEQPSTVPWGVSAIFKDLYGNPYNLVEAHF